MIVARFTDREGLANEFEGIAKRSAEEYVVADAETWRTAWTSGRDARRHSKEQGRIATEPRTKGHSGRLFACSAAGSSPASQPSRARPHWKQ